MKNHVHINAIFTAYDCNYGLFLAGFCFFSAAGANPTFFGTNHPFYGRHTEDFLYLPQQRTISNTFPLEN